MFSSQLSMKSRQVLLYAEPVCSQIDGLNIDVLLNIYIHI